MKQIFIVLLLCTGAAAEALPEWFKGNTHTHTDLSDGDSGPDAVVEWYRAHGYHFVVITDHNRTADVRTLNARHGSNGGFLVIAGNEVTCRSEGKPVHLTALNVRGRLRSWSYRTRLETLRENITRIRRSGASPVICHPNDNWALNISILERVRSCRLIEIWNQHPEVNNTGGGGMPGTEALWDSLLTRGMRLYGVACDDMHHMREFSPEKANPGRGWVQVWCERLTPGEITTALERGDFYSSTGVVLRDIRYDGKTLRVSVRTGGPLRHTVEYIGANGRVLRKTHTPESEYRMNGNERYTRVRVTDSNGRRAWTQPVFPGSPDAQPYVR